MIRKIGFGRGLLLVVAVSWMFFCDGARAQTGVSDDRVSLPEAPGSLEGLGDNADIDLNMGLMRDSIPIEVPGGFAGVTPDLALSYSSGGGNGVVGMGFSLELPSIERTTFRGLPRYDSSDEFAANGSEQLVAIPGTDPPEYRARFERGFVRYRWHERGTGGEGYWTAEYPDGTVGYFGADQSGTIVESARFGPEGRGTFRYHLVAVVDPFGHELRYTYGSYDGVPLVERIGWVFEGGAPRYAVNFSYEARGDYISDCKSGRNELLKWRLGALYVVSSGVKIRTYDLAYEDEADSGGVSRLESMTQKGRSDELLPMVRSFTYSQSLGAACGEASCTEPYLVDMGSTGVAMLSGAATLVDINGDALPDILATSGDTGPHRFFINEIHGTQQLFAGPFESAVGGASEHKLGSPYVQVLDLDGNGFADIINTKTGGVLWNDPRAVGAERDWSSASSFTDVDLPDFGDEFDGDDELRTIRFLDYDGDRRIDVMRSTSVSTTIYRNTGAGGFEVDAGVETIGWGFEDDALQLADMNGDDLLDPVRVGAGSLSYRLNLGRGKWSEAVTVDGLTFAEAEKHYVELEDLNGDGLSDLVVVVGDEVRYALSRNGDRFDEPRTIASSAALPIPERTDQTTVLFADMNGNGSSDIVWVDASGGVKFLELFAVRPNLITRMENGLGLVTEVSYVSSVEMMAADETDWTYRLPHPMTLVERIDTWDGVSGVHNITEYDYRDGYYDGVEKQFRGYVFVESTFEGDAHVEAGRTAYIYDVGQSDPYRFGLLLEESAYSEDRALSTVLHEYDDCEVAGVPESGLALAVRYVCEISTTTTLKEGRPQSEWVTTQIQSEYDGYGNVTLEKNLGVTAVGGGGCGGCDGPAGSQGTPCGADCSGDESYTQTQYISPSEQTTGDRWILGAAYRSRSYGVVGSDNYTDTFTFYDGEAFMGLPFGRLEKGKAARVTQRKDTADGFVEASRNRFDEHGNVVETIDPLGSLDETGAHRRIYTMDETGLHLLATDVLLKDAQGEAYRLRREYRYDDVWGKPVESTQWMLVEGGAVVSSRRSSYFSYDNFGRLSALVKPGGDTLASPTTTIAYELEEPASRVVIKSRSQVGGQLDEEKVRCFDARGRMYQERTRLSQGKYQVTGYTVYNKRGEALRVYQPYIGDSAACDTAPPPKVAFVSNRRDAANRVIEITEPDAELYGTASVMSAEYGPLWTASYDFEDNDPQSPHYETPVITRRNGLGRQIAVERTQKNAPTAVIALSYDELGNLRGYIDPKGNEKLQEYDLLGRVVRVDDPDAGTTTMEYDDAGNLIETHDARGKVVKTVYDGANRPVARYDASDEEGTKVAWVYDRSETCPKTKCTNTEGMLVETSYPLFGMDGAEQGLDQLGYDARARTVYRARTLVNGGFAFELARVYDNMDRLTQVTYPDGRTVAMGYDDASRVTRVGEYAPSIAYDDRGLTARVTYGNGLSRTNTYDELMRLAKAETRPKDSGLLLGFGYTRNRLGNLDRVEDLRVDEASGLPGFDAAYTYDAWERVTGAVLGEGAKIEALSYKYDEIDNLLESTSSLGNAAPAHVGSYSYDGKGPHAVTKAGSRSYSYDAAGYMTDRGDVTLTWDALGRLTAARRGDDVLGEFVYGADHDRVLTSEGGHLTQTISDDFEVEDGVVVYYPRLGRERLARVESTSLQTTLLTDLAVKGEDADGAIDAADAWLSEGARLGAVEINTDEPLPANRLLAASVRRLLVGAEEKVTYLHTDHLGSLIAATDDQGALVGQRAFSPQGVVQPGAFGYVDKYGFTGQKSDESTGLIHFKHRHFDPDIGRWLSPDPAFSIVTLESIKKLGEFTSAYAYVAGNYANSFDPDGLMMRRDPKDRRVAKYNAAGSVKDRFKRTVDTAKDKVAPAQRTYDKNKKTIEAGSTAYTAAYVGTSAATGDLVGVVKGTASLASTALSRRNQRIENDPTYDPSTTTKALEMASTVTGAAATASGVAGALGGGPPAILAGLGLAVAKSGLDAAAHVSKTHDVVPYAKLQDNEEQNPGRLERYLNKRKGYVPLHNEI